jgi:hypothetical protein
VSGTPQPSATSHSADPPSEAKNAQQSGAKIHRVCIGCNNMFEVTLDNFEAKHCPVCRKE